MQDIPVSASLPIVADKGVSVSSNSAASDVAAPGQSTGQFGEILDAAIAEKMLKKADGEELLDLAATDAVPVLETPVNPIDINQIQASLIAAEETEEEQQKGSEETSIADLDPSLPLALATPGVPANSLKTDIKTPISTEINPASSLPARDKSSAIDTTLESAKITLDKFVPAAETAGSGKAVPDKAAISAIRQAQPVLEVAAPVNDPTNVPLSNPLPGRLDNATAVTSSMPVQLSVAPQVGAPDWANNFGQKIVWMSSQQLQTADLHLNPPNLGPVEVHLSMGGEQTNATFTSSHPTVREAIESALPRLKEMLADSGITLGNVSVSSDSFYRQAQDQGDQRQQRSGYREPVHALAGSFALEGSTTGTWNLTHNGLVDTFA